MAEIGLAQAIKVYRKAKAAKEGLVKKHKEAVEPYDQAIERVKQLLIRHLQDGDTKSARTNEGSVSLVTNHRAKVQDWDVFTRYVADEDAWHLLTRSCGSRACTEVLKETGESPPGIEITTEIGLRVSAPK